jgi:TetR/AcrR family transcriptional regulator, lmrAB and yxaGH operons repressor
MPRATRDRMIDSAVEALERNGFAGMSFTQVLEASGAVRGAIYHHFPGGKSQLAAEAAGRTDTNVRSALGRLPHDSPHATVEAFLATVRPVVERSVAGGGCAVAAVTPCADSDNEQLRRLAAHAFASWIGLLAEALTKSGMSPAQASNLASLLITMLEGSNIVCRAAHNLDAFEQASRAALAIAATAASDPSPQVKPQTRRRSDPL